MLGAAMGRTCGASVDVAAAAFAGGATSLAIADEVATAIDGRVGALAGGVSSDTVLPQPLRASMVSRVRAKGPVRHGRCVEREGMSGVSMRVRQGGRCRQGIGVRSV